MDDFRRFLIENKVSVSIVSFAIAYYLKELIDSFYGSTKTEINENWSGFLN